LQGTIKKYEKDFGWGFINGADGNSYYFHCKNLVERLEKGEPIREGKVCEFETEERENQKTRQPQIVAVDIIFI